MRRAVATLLSLHVRAGLYATLVDAGVVVAPQLAERTIAVTAAQWRRVPESSPSAAAAARRWRCEPSCGAIGKQEAAAMDRDLDGPTIGVPPARPGHPRPGGLS